MTLPRGFGRLNWILVLLLSSSLYVMIHLLPSCEFKHLNIASTFLMLGFLLNLFVAGTLSLNDFWLGLWRILRACIIFVSAENSMFGHNGCSSLNINSIMPQRCISMIYWRISQPKTLLRLLNGQRLHARDFPIHLSLRPQSFLTDHFSIYFGTKAWGCCVLVGSKWVKRILIEPSGMIRHIMEWLGYVRFAAFVIVVIWGVCGTI